MNHALLSIWNAHSLLADAGDWASTLYAARRRACEAVGTSPGSPSAILSYFKYSRACIAIFRPEIGWALRFSIGEGPVFQPRYVLRLPLKTLHCSHTFCQQNREPGTAIISLSGLLTWLQLGPLESSEWFLRPRIWRKRGMDWKAGLKLSSWEWSGKQDSLKAFS